MGIVTNFNSSRISISNAYVPYSNKSSISNAYVGNSNTNYINPIKSETMDFSNLIIDNFNNNDNKDDAKIKYTEASHGILDDEKAQGMTKTDKYVYISAHDPDDKLGSRIYVYDRYNGDYLGFIRLADFNDKEDITNNSHVGGITYDKDHDILYVTEYSGEIVAYNNKTIEKYIEDSEIIKVKNKLLEYAENDKLADIAHDNLIYVDSTNFAQKIDELFYNIKDTDIYQYLSEKLSFIDIKKLQDEINKDLPSYIEKSRSEQNCLIDMRFISKNEYESDFHVPMLFINNKYPLLRNKELNVTDTNKNAATTYYHDGILYSATFGTNYKGELRAYKVTTITDEKLNKKVLKYDFLYSTEVPKQTQGIAVTEYNGKKYLLSTQSLGPNCSTITTSIINDDGTIEEQGVHTYWDYMGMQGIYVDDTGEVTCISEFENKTKKLNMKKLTTNYVDKNSYEYLYHQAAQKIIGYFYDGGFKKILNSPTNFYKEMKNDIKELDELDAGSVIWNDMKKNPWKTTKGLTSEIIDNTKETFMPVYKVSKGVYKYEKAYITEHIKHPSKSLYKDVQICGGTAIFLGNLAKEGTIKVYTGAKDLTSDFYEEASKQSAGEFAKDFGGEVLNTIDDYVPDAIKPWKWHS